MPACEELARSINIKFIDSPSVALDHPWGMLQFKSRSGIIAIPVWVGGYSMSLSVALLKTRRFCDDRGWFSETYSAPRLSERGIDAPFVRDSQSFSMSEGTVRGIHFQRPPDAQAKLVRCIRGKILDFAVDLRGGASFGKYVFAELSAENADQLFIPVGFGHAFITLEDNCEIAYKFSAIYSPECDGGIIWNDKKYRGRLADAAGRRYNFREGSKASAH